MSLRERAKRVAARVRGLFGSADRRGRVHAERDDDVVVFLIGMRINAFWKVHRWIPLFLVAPRMVRELRQDEDSGLLGSWTMLSPPRTIGFVQYWDDFESLREYARDSDRLHLDEWGRYNETADGSVGIWHETYRVEDYETVYNNVGPRGLGAAAGSELVPATGERTSAAGRLGDRNDSVPAAASPGQTAQRSSE